MLINNIYLKPIRILTWALLFCFGNLFTQNKLGIIKNNQLYNAYPTGIIYSKGKILYSVQGDNIAGGGGSKSVNQLIVYNTNLDTLQTTTLAAGTGTNSNFSLKNYSGQIITGTSYSYKPGYNSSIIFKKSNAIFPDTSGHKAYASKLFYRNFLMSLYQLKDSSYVGSTYVQTQILPYPYKFGLWWFDKNRDTLRNVYYDFYLWNSGGCLLRNIYELPKKDLLLGGYTDSLDAFDGLVMRVDSLGAIKFARSIGTDSSDQLNFIKIKKSYYLYGNTNLHGSTNYDFNRLLLIKIDTLGDIIFAKLIDNGEGGLSRTANAINFNDNLLLYGSQYNLTTNSQKGSIAILMDTNGVVKKYHKAIYNPITNYNTQNPREEFTSAVLDSLKNVYLQYYYYNNAFTNNDGFQTGLVKLDSNLVGCIPSVVQSFTTTDVTSLVHSVPINYTVKRDSLIRVTGTITQSYGISGITEDCAAYVGLQEYSIQNQFIKLYPNPSVGLFNYELLDANSMTGDYTMEIYNSVGAIIKRYIINKNDIQGNIDLTEFSNGIYFINIINANKTVLNTKLSVIK